MYISRITVYLIQTYMYIVGRISVDCVKNLDCLYQFRLWQHLRQVRLHATHTYTVCTLDGVTDNLVHVHVVAWMVDLNFYRQFGLCDETSYLLISWNHQRSRYCCWFPIRTFSSHSEINISALQPSSLVTVGVVFWRFSSFMNVWQGFIRYSPYEMHNSRKTNEYRCTAVPILQSDVWWVWLKPNGMFNIIN